MRSLRRQLTIRLVLAMAALLLLGGALLGALVHSRLLREFDAGLLAQARALASLVEEERSGAFEFEFAAHLMPEFGAGSGAALFQIWGPGGGEIARSPSLGAGSLEAPAGFGGQPALWNLTLPSGQAGRAAALRFVAPSDERPAGARGAEVTLVCARERESLNSTLAALWGGVALAALALPVLAALTVWALVRRTLKPLDRVAQESARIDAANLSHRFAVEGLPAELRPVCARLNESLARLEAAFARERRFTSAVAHELRTPLAELRAAAEVALRWGEDAALTRRGLETSHEVALQMQRVVTALLDLTRSEAGRLAVEPEPVDAAALVREVWRPLEQSAASRSLRVAFHLPGEFTVQTDRTLLRAILTNLASNAVEHTPSGGEIAWHVEETEDGAAITVTNPASNLRPEDIPHMAEPFWRRDAARTDGQHSGLGLTIAAAFAEALGGALEMNLAPAGELRARLDLPCGLPAPSA